MSGSTAADSIVRPHDKVLVMAQLEHEIVTANEGFLIGVLQAVSGGSLVAGFSQSEPVVKLIGKLP